MSSATPPKKEITNETRTILAFVLMGLILLATPYVYRMLGISTAPPAANSAATTAAKSSVQAKLPAAAPSAAGAPMATSGGNPAAGASNAETVEAASEQEQAIDTTRYHVAFSNRGAVVKSWTLKDYKDSTGKPLELVNGPGATKVGYPFSFAFRGTEPADLNKALWVGHPLPGGLGIRFNFSDGKTTASKTFAFQPDGYMVQYSDDVTSNGMGIPHLVQWRGGFGDMAVQKAAGQQATIHYDAQKNKLVRDGASSAKKGPVNADGDFSFAGIDDQYFAVAALPPPNTSLETTTFDDVVPSTYDTADQAYPGVAFGGAVRNQMGIYVGPKEVNMLHAVNPRLDGIVDWGWFGIIARPLFLVLHWMNDQIVHNYGWSIVLLTVVINLALFPIRIANLKSMRKMQALQPEMSKINEKYKGISMSDPRAAGKQQEMMDLYKKHGVNPMGGCIPMLIQLPFLYAFYKVLAVTIEMRHASWLWVGDLSQPEHLAIRVLPLVMMASTFMLQKMTPLPAGGDPNQQKMMQFMPLMYVIFFWSASSGLVLYWLTSNLIQVAQQFLFNKTAAPVEARAMQKSANTAKKIVPKDGRSRA
jgi:YidC/Oxa1 family membrane protein insertase